ncbi:MAG: carboxypeptidase regulatory-like domain-containing protein [Sulfurimonas sp.]
MRHKISLIMTLVTLSAFVTGCVQTDVRKPNYQAGFWDSDWGKYDPNNIDMSDIDENLTETEMLITENMPDERVSRIAFPLEEYAGLKRTGKGTIKGKIYLKNNYGDTVKLGGGTRLYLNPMTSYSNQWYYESYIGGRKMQKADSRLFNYLRFTAANSDGSFSFYGVPSGRYFLIGTVKCGQECGYAAPKSIRLATKVEVYGNQVKQKDLTRTLENY